MNATDSIRNGKLKTKFFVMLLLLSVLVGCSAPASASKDRTRMIDGFMNVTDDGLFFADDRSRLNFFDFETMRSSIICAKPNCTHTDPEKCSSFGMTNHPILYNNKLYFFDNDFLSSEKNGKPVFYNTAAVYKSDIDGTNRTAVCVIDDLYINAGNRLLLMGDIAYFPMSKISFDEYGNSTGYEEGWLCSYDLSANEFNRIEKICEGYHTGVTIYGCWNGKIYLSAGYSDKKIPYPFGSENDSEAMAHYFEQINEAVSKVFTVWDTKVGATVAPDLPEPMYMIEEGYYIYGKDGGTAVVRENGEEIYLKDFPPSDDIRILNDIMFDCTDKICAELSGNVEIKHINIEKGQNVIAYQNGSYILRKYIIDQKGNSDTVSGYEYTKMKLDELISPYTS